MRKLRTGIAALLVVGAVAVPMASAGAGGAGGSATEGTATASGTGTQELAVRYADGVDAAAARAAISEAGGTILREVSAIGLAQVVTDNADFARQVEASGTVQAVARNHAVGESRRGMAHRFAEERALEDRASFAPAGGGANNAGGVGVAPNKPGPETFSDRQWDMEMIDAPAAHATTKGAGVLVGIIDTGIDASHPDLAANFDEALSENFTTDIPAIDGPCEYPSCHDPADVDHGGHGTHVAGTVAADDDGFGIMGVAPDATLVNLRAGQDSGYFFFVETVAALTAAADKGIDVVNMSFYTDPWLYNCASEADYVSGSWTPEQIAEQAMIRDGILDAVAYARSHGVTLVAAAGNEASDLQAATRSDATSPDYPGGTEIERVVSNDCLDLPAEAPGVIEVSALGPSGNKADYSNYGAGGTIDVSAPGGWYRDYIGTRFFRQPENMILSSYPAGVVAEEGALNRGGGLKDPHFYKRDCTQGKPCAYYQYLQGTSMASPHATGVVALIIAAYRDAHGGTSPTPDQVAQILAATATDTPCPDPADLVYTDEGRPASWTAHCTGDASYNGVYGDGIIDAAAAVAGV
ncbi:MAG TPA: S8 family serine peptidase [Acidimicrobiales bacterium]|nr:S8 family serine peptidase [Acidimicrobiales bacterium]